MYIHEAANIATGTPYDRTGYIYNPFNPSLGPKSYPPVFPMLLSPIYAIAGLNLSLMKMEIIVLFGADLVITHVMLKHVVSSVQSTVIIALLGFSPYYWEFCANILSDIPFSLFCIASLLLIHLQQERRDTERFRTCLVESALTGCFLYLAFGTRTAGIALVIAYIIYEFFKWRRPRLVFLAALGCFGILVVGQRVLLPSNARYIDQIQLTPHALLSTMYQNAWAYERSLSDLWSNGHFPRVAAWLSHCTLALSCVGFAFRVTTRQRASILESFYVTYSLLILAWPSYQGLRLLLPIIPLYLLYALLGLKLVTKAFARVRLIYAVILSIIVLSYVGFYSSAQYGPLREGVGTNSSVALFRWIRTNTGTRDVFIFWKPRALSLYTGRPAATYQLASTDAVCNFVTSINTKYVVVSQLSSDDKTYLTRVVRSQRCEGQPV
jgi:hypothetical protein